MVKSIYLLSFLETTIFLLSNKQSFKTTGVDCVTGANWLDVVAVVGKGGVIFNIFVAELSDIVEVLTRRLSAMKESN